MALGVLGLIWQVGGGDPENDTWFTVLASAVQSVIFVFAAVVIARMSGSVSMRDFGLVRAPFGQALAKSIGIIVAYFILLFSFNQLVDIAPDDAPEILGADTGTFAMLAFAVLVIVFAPIGEELFYRGMVFRSLANGAGVWPGAIVSGVLFGVVHIDSADTDRLLQVALLSVFGVLLAVLYAWSRTLYAPIALHATNNSLAVIGFADKQDSAVGSGAAVALWLLMIALCIFGWRVTDRDAPPPPPAPVDPNAPVVFVAPGSVPEQFFTNPERPDQSPPPT